MTTTERSRIYNFWIILAAFFVRTFTHWLTPMHEWLHGMVAVLLGGEIVEVFQTRITYTLPDMSQWPIVTVSGFWLEFCMYWLVAYLWPRPFVGKVAAGIAPAVWLYGLRSIDFAQVADIYPANYLLFILFGLFMLLVLLYRGLPDSEADDKQTERSKVNLSS